VNAGAIVIAAKVADRVRLAGMVVLEAEVQVVDRADRGRDVGLKVQAPAGRGAMDLESVGRLRAEGFRGMIGVIRAIRLNVASHRSRCRKSSLLLFPTKRVSSPWPGRSR